MYNNNFHYTKLKSNHASDIMKMVFKYVCNVSQINYQKKYYRHVNVFKGIPLILLLNTS